MAENLTGMATRDYESVANGGKIGRGGSPEAKGAMDGREGVEETKGPMGTTSGHGDRTKRHSRFSYSLTRTAYQTSIRLRRRSPVSAYCFLATTSFFLFRNLAWATETVTTWTKITLHWNPAFYSLQILSLPQLFLISRAFFSMCAASGGASSHYTFLAGNLTADTWRLLLSVFACVL